MAGRDEARAKVFPSSGCRIASAAASCLVQLPLSKQQERCRGSDHSGGVATRLWLSSAASFRSLTRPPPCELVTPLGISLPLPPQPTYPLPHPCRVAWPLCRGGVLSFVALPLATPGVDQLARTRVRGAQPGAPACPTPLPSHLLQFGLTPLDKALSNGRADAAALQQAVAAAALAAAKGH